MKAVFYIPTAYIGAHNEWDVKAENFDKINLATKEQLIYLNQNNMEIGSHGHRHLNQFKIDKQTQKYEIEYSKNLLEDLLKRPIHSFAHPYGEVAKGYKELLQEAGYKYGLSIYKGRMNRFALRRIGIHENDTKKSIHFKLSKIYGLLRYLVDPALSVKKASLNLNLFILSTYFSNFLSVHLQDHIYAISFTLH